MKYNSKIHNRKSIRLKGYDYSKSGLYFITICTKNREYLFGEIYNDEMELNELGIIVQQCWKNIPNHFPNFKLYNFIIMPNHIHGIIEITTVGAKNLSPNIQKSKNLSPNIQKNQYPYIKNKSINNNVLDKNCNIINSTNINSTNINSTNINRAKDFSPLRNGTSKTIGSVVRGFKIGVTKWSRQNTNILQIWQRNYWEHIIKNDEEYTNIAEYIVHNPIKWNNDKLNDGIGNSVLETISISS